MICYCKDFAENMDKVNAPILLLNARNPGTTEYDGKSFAFCPWCGERLKSPVIKLGGGE